MEKSINTRQSRTCYACGAERPEHALRPFGRHGGRVVSWVCLGEHVAVPAPRQVAPVLEVAR